MKDIKYMNTLWHKVEIQEKKQDVKKKQARKRIKTLSLIGLGLLAMTLLIGADLEPLVLPLSLVLMIVAVRMENKKAEEDACS